jgi:hypothetical protein
VTRTMPPIPMRKLNWSRPLSTCPVLFPTSRRWSYRTYRDWFLRGWSMSRGSGSAGLRIMPYRARLRREVGAGCTCCAGDGKYGGQVTRRDPFLKA